jgi:hypothetical protein
MAVRTYATSTSYAELAKTHGASVIREQRHGSKPRLVRSEMSYANVSFLLAIKYYNCNDKLCKSA